MLLLFCFSKRGLIGYSSRPRPSLSCPSPLKKKEEEGEEEQL
jgi:hypothetical protein